jgi:hypothetical protein
VSRLARPQRWFQEPESALHQRQRHGCAFLRRAIGGFRACLGQTIARQAVLVEILVVGCVSFQEIYGWPDKAVHADAEKAGFLGGRIKSWIVIILWGG